MKLKSAFILSQITILMSFVITLVLGLFVYHKFTYKMEVNQVLNQYSSELNNTLALQEQFFLYRDRDIKEQLKTQIQIYNSAHIALQNQLESEPLAQLLLNQLQSSVVDFKSNLLEQITLQEKLGYHQDEGLRGYFRNSVHQLQELSKRVGNQKLELLVLELRRREKDYLMRWQDSFLKMHSDLIVTIRNHIQQSKSNTEEKLLKLADYDKGFTQYIYYLQMQGQTPTQGVIGKNNSLKGVIAEKYLNLANYANSNIKDSAEQALIIALSLIIISTLISLFISFFVNKRITFSMLALNKTIDDVVGSDDFSLRCEHQGNDEISHLAENIDQLLAHIEELIQRLGSAQRRLIEDAKMASLGTMVKGFAHELNTPLGIAITSESFLSDKLNKLKQDFEQGRLNKTMLQEVIDEAQSSLTLIEANLNRSANLINNFKQVAAHQEYDELVEFDVHAFLENLLSSLKHETDKHSINIKLDVQHGIILNSYLGAFSQIFTIFLINSIRHGRKPNTPLNIEILCKIVSGVLHFRYIDDGLGINESIIEKVFEPFVTSKRGQGGTGLGLSIVYNLVTQKLKGEIELQSIEQQGVCIYLHFNNIPFQLNSSAVENTDTSV